MKATLIGDVSKKETTLDKKLNVYKNGSDNAYPELMDRYINNSVTAKTASNLMKQSLLQKGLGVHDKVIVNKNKNLTLYNFADDIANSKVRQRGCFIWIGYDANYKISDVEVLPFQNCRIGKKDTEDYSSKILYSKNWNESKQDDLIVFDVYNHDTLVINSQVEKSGGWGKYKGQILYVNDDSDYIYPLSRIDAVQYDCDNEQQASIYKNTLLRKGFFGKTLMITRPLVDRDLPKSIEVNGEITRNLEYYNQESEQTAFKDTIESFVGAENAGGALHIEIDYEHEKLEDAILFKNIESKLDDKLFEYTERSVRKNILIAFNNLPNGLVEQSEGIFSNSGEAIIQMQKQFDENCEIERSQFTDLLNDIWKMHVKYDGLPIQLTLKQYANATAEVNQ
jgi:hypothetical protein